LKSILLRISDSLGDIQKFFLHPTVTTKTSLCYSAGDHFFLKINAPVRWHPAFLVFHYQPFPVPGTQLFTP